MGKFTKFESYFDEEVSILLLTKIILLWPYNDFE